MSTYLSQAAPLQERVAFFDHHASTSRTMEVRQAADRYGDVFPPLPARLWNHFSDIRLAEATSLRKFEVHNLLMICLFVFHLVHSRNPITIYEIVSSKYNSRNLKSFTQILLFFILTSRGHYSAQTNFVVWKRH